jgi:hypothetical protein
VNAITTATFTHREVVLPFQTRNEKTLQLLFVMIIMMMISSSLIFLFLIAISLSVLALVCGDSAVALVVQVHSLLLVFLSFFFKL